MLNEEAGSSTSARQREVLLGSPARATPLRAGANNPPPYGAQHRQDALWKGGNEALPPEWKQHNVLDGGTFYHDDTLLLSSSNRPLPGVRLDYTGQLVVAGCEWHISPLGQSYFVNHNTRSTSWRKPARERPAGSLAPKCIMEGHSRCIWSLACLGTSYNILSASEDCSIRQWKRDGEPVGKPLDSHGARIGSIALSPDEIMTVSGSVDGRLRMWNIKKGSMVGDPWEGHNDQVRCLDWSPDALEIASGSNDGTIRRWNPDTGRQIAPPIDTRHGWVHAVKYSSQGDKFTSGGQDKMIRVWSKDGQLLVEIEGHEYSVTSLCWSKDGTHIFSASYDATVRQWRSTDGEELVVLRGHTNPVRSLCLAPDESHLVSASGDCSIRIWDLKTNQPVGYPLLHDDEVVALAMFPDGKYFASAGKDAKVYVWSMEAALEQQGSDQGTDNGNAKPDGKLKGLPARPRDNFPSRPIVSEQHENSKGSAKYGNDFFGNDTNHAAPPASTSNPLHWRRLLDYIGFGARPANAPQLIPRKPRNWNFKLFTVGNSRRAVDVAAARDEDRYGIAIESDAEAAAAMQRTSSKETNGSKQRGQPAPKVQGSDERPTQSQASTGGIGDVSCEVKCCGFSFGCRRSVSHQS